MFFNNFKVFSNSKYDLHALSITYYIGELFVLCFSNSKISKSHIWWFTYLKGNKKGHRNRSPTLIYVGLKTSINFYTFSINTV